MGWTSTTAVTMPMLVTHWPTRCWVGLGERALEQLEMATRPLEGMYYESLPGMETEDLT